MQIHFLVSAAEIVRATQTGARVARVQGDRVLYGTARSLSTAEGHHARTVEQAHLRITWAEGFDSFIPLADAVDEYDSGYLVLNYAVAAEPEPLATRLPDTDGANA